MILLVIKWVISKIYFKPFKKINFLGNFKRLIYQNYQKKTTIKDPKGEI